MSIENIVTRYIESFNESDAAKRAAILAEIYVDDCCYTDPHAVVSGRAAIADFIAGVQARLPGLRFELAGTVDAHHGQARFRWHATPKGASAPAAIGFDVVVLEGGRIRQVYGFLDAPTQPA
ncbi:nuclear transport factor 2 family protein [soil metagenome]